MVNAPYDYDDDNDAERHTKQKSTHNTSRNITIAPRIACYD